MSDNTDVLPRADGVRTENPHSEGRRSIQHPLPVVSFMDCVLEEYITNSQHSVPTGRMINERQFEEDIQEYDRGLF
jgi:hypothetical protein